MDAKKTHILINNALWNKGEKVYRKFKRIRNRPEVIIFNNFRNSWTQYLESEFEQSKIADFLEIRKRKLKDSFVLDPVFTNQAYKNFETLSQTKLRHPCSTGFIGMFLMSRSCRSVSAFGFCNSKTDGNYRTMWHDYKNEHKVYEMWSRDVHFNLTLYPPPLWYRLKHPAACNGGEMNACPPSPRGSKFFKFHVVFGKIWQNRMSGPLSGGLAPSSRGNPGSATDTDSNFSYKKI